MSCAGRRPTGLHNGASRQTLLPAGAVGPQPGSMKQIFLASAVLFLAAGNAALCPAQQAATPVADASFASTLAPFLKSYCINCHSGTMPEAKLSLEKYHD